MVAGEGLEPPTPGL